MSDIPLNTGALQSLKAMKEIGHITVSEFLKLKTIETQLRYSTKWRKMFVKNRKYKWLIFLKYNALI